MTSLDEELNAARFLKDFKALAQSKLYVVPREVNQTALIDMGLTFEDRRNAILSLGVEDYCSGPEPDSDRAGDVWIFGKVIQTTEVYLKLKIVGYFPLGSATLVRQAKCISFHPAAEPLSYPLKK